MKERQKLHSTVTTATDRSTTETSSSSEQAVKFSKKWLRGRALRYNIREITEHHFTSTQSQTEAGISVTEYSTYFQPVAPKEEIEQAVASLYFLATQRIPQTTNFEPLLDFGEVLGLHVKTDIQVARNATCTSMRFIQEMLSRLMHN